MTTAAFKIAGGVETPSSSVARPIKQHPILSAFVSKITKAFLDALYAILDGLVLLASDESPIVHGVRPDISNTVQMNLNPLELVNLKDGVCQSNLIDVGSIQLRLILFPGYTTTTCYIKLQASV